MITQQELTDKCTPEIINMMVELANGFELRSSISTTMLYFKPQTQVTTSIHAKDLFEPDNTLIFSTLISRAVEGWNRLNKAYIMTTDSFCYTTTNLHQSEERRDFKNYQPTTLTPAECAMLDCLIDILKEERICGIK